MVSIGAATSFEMHGLRREAVYFTSFYLYSVTRVVPRGLRALIGRTEMPRPYARAAPVQKAPLDTEFVEESHDAPR